MATLDEGLAAVDAHPDRRRTQRYRGRSSLIAIGGMQITGGGDRAPA